MILKKGDKLKFKNGEHIYILNRKGDGYECYNHEKQKSWHPKKWFEMMLEEKKLTK